MNDTLGQRLRQLRRDRGLSQAQVARQLADTSGNPTITRHEVSRYERSVRRPTWWLPYYAEVFGVPVADLHDTATPIPTGLKLDDSDALELIRRVAASDLGTDTLEHLEAAVDDLAVAYPATPPDDLLIQLRWYLRSVKQLLDARMTLDEHRRLLVVGSWLSLLAATCQIDLHARRPARAHLTTAAQLAKHTNHAELAAWCLETEAWQTLTDGNYRRAIDLSRGAQALAPAGSSPHIQATAQEGRAWARLGESSETYDTLSRLDQLVSPLTVPDRPEHHYRYDPTKAEAYLATTLSWLGDPAAEHYARHILSHLETPTDGTPRPRRAAAARLDLSLALVAGNKPDEAAHVVLQAITSGRLVPSNYWRANEVLTQLEHRNIPTALEAKEAYHEFCRSEEKKSGIEQ